jgi:hypothetical protein
MSGCMLEAEVGRGQWGSEARCLRMNRIAFYTWSRRAYLKPGEQRVHRMYDARAECAGRWEKVLAEER